MILRKILILALITPMISGCGIYRQSFDCQAKEGVGCKSVTQVNDMIDDGSIFFADSKKKSSKKSNPNSKKHNREPEAGALTNTPRIYMAPYEENGVTYSGSYIFIDAPSVGEK